MTHAKDMVWIRSLGVDLNDLLFSGALFEDVVVTHGTEEALSDKATVNLVPVFALFLCSQGTSFRAEFDELSWSPPMTDSKDMVSTMSLAACIHAVPCFRTAWWKTARRRHLPTRPP